MMGQLRKQILTIATLLLLALPVRADSLVTAIVTDPISGVAIDGYDPVSYFLGSEPQMGKPDFEYYWGGVPWYFVNPGNRDAFARAPEIYAPQYGGHCVMSLARGYLSDGKPRLYVIEAMKLYFFYSTGNRDAFLMSRGPTLEAAILKWPELAGDLVGGSGRAEAVTAVADSGAAVAPEAAAASVESH
jgi:YHS domain-containing protein